MGKAKYGTRGAWLMLAAHVDAARLNPRAWFTAMWWRIQGKRVRARAQFAPLLATSARAYRLWLRNEPVPELWDEGHKPAIVALVHDGPGLDETIGSLSGQGVAAVVLGTPEIATLAEAAAHIDWRSDPWLMPLTAGDVLAPRAIAAYRAAAARTHQQVVYADDDILDGAGRRTTPHFKPRWNAELFRHFDYLTGACIIKIEADEIGHLTWAKRSDPDWAARLISAVVDKGEPIRLPHVLHHRRSRPMPTLPELPEARPTRSSEIVERALPKVSVIVPTRNRLDLLRTCLEGLERTDYSDLEVIIVDNGSDDPETLAYLRKLAPVRYKVLRHPGPFNFSKLNNSAAKIAAGKLLCLLNNDIEVIDPRWLTTMVQQALRPEVGAVGAQLRYPDGRIQHAGVVLGICGGAAHAHRFLRPDEEGYFSRHALPQFVSAVTAACLVVKRECYEAVEGFDEQNFAVAFNDVDFCMRLNERGWQSLYEPRAMLIHHESVSRGLDRDPVGAARFAGELAALKAAWRTGAGPDEEIDPFHHPELNRFSERFVVRL